MTSKFISFFRLVEACAQEGCPVCRCMRGDAVRYLDALLYEQVNDPATRSALHASWGFCNWHAWLAREVAHAGLGIGIIAEDLLGRAIGRLRRLLIRIRRGKLTDGWLSRLVGRGPRIPLLKSWQRRTVCPGCQMGRDDESSYLRIVLDFMADLQFDRAFEKSTGLCVPHMLRLLELGARHPNLETVVERAQTKWQRLQAELKNFVAKHGYRAAEPFTEAEARSWALVIELLSGAPGIFGNELHSGRSTAQPAPPPAGPVDQLPSSESDVETLGFEKEKLELRVKELTDQLSDVSSRAAALHYRLWKVLEDRKVLEMNLAGEQGSSRLLERTIEELRKEIDRLKAEAGSDIPRGA